jgi:hypothetical protein
VTTAYDGTFLVDPKTLDLVRLAVRTAELPDESGACVHINDAGFLLPSETLFRIVTTTGVEDENRTVYTACHEFRGESVLKFEQQADVSSPKTAPSPEKPLTVPAGLPFTVIFTRDIQTSTAAAGDPISGELATPIRDPGGTILVAKGAVVTGRILRIQHYYLPERSWALTIRPETLDVGGTPVPFSSTASRVPESAAFEFRKPAEHFVIKKGLTSDWVTGAPR